MFRNCTRYCIHYVKQVSMKTCTKKHEIFDLRGNLESLKENAEGYTNMPFAIPTPMLTFSCKLLLGAPLQSNFAQSAFCEPQISRLIDLKGELLLEKDKLRFQKTVICQKISSSPMLYLLLQHNNLAIFKLQVSPILSWNQINSNTEFRHHTIKYLAMSI